MEKLVSIITPCYNLGHVLHYLIESILSQTYSNIEWIAIDDGSKDNTKQVIFSYRKQFEDRNFKLKYVFQENQGLGAAINTGLKHIEGDYFCWPDADDYLASDSISKRVKFLEEHLEYGLVRSDAYLYNSDDRSRPIGYITHKNRLSSIFNGRRKARFKESNLMEDYILEKNIIFCPGCHMVRTSSFKTVNPSMSIYPGRRGQNYQLLLPLINKYKFGYIDEPLYNFIIYKNSMSRGDNSYHLCAERYNGLETYVIETLKKMDLSDADRNYYLALVFKKTIYNKYKAALKFGEKDKKKELYYQLKRLGCIKTYDIIMNYVLNPSITNKISLIKSYLRDHIRGI